MEALLEPERSSPEAELLDDSSVDEDHEDEEVGLLTPKKIQRQGQRSIHYSPQEKAKIVKLYSECMSGLKVQSLWAKEFPNKKVPAGTTIRRIYKKFLETGTVANKYHSLRSKKAQSLENIEKVKKIFLKSPSKSIRQVASEVDIPHTTVARILSSLKGKEGGQIKRARIMKFKTEPTKAVEILQKKSPNLSDFNSEKGMNKSGVISRDDKKCNKKKRSKTDDNNSISAKNCKQFIELDDENLSYHCNDKNDDEVGEDSNPKETLSLNLETESLVAVSDPSISIIHIMNSVGNYLPGLFQAIVFAAEKHKNQRRKDPEKTPYINHPLGVADILVREGEIEDLEIIQAAILHDTVEDTDTTLEEIKAQFGDKVAEIVGELTDDKSLKKEERKALRIVNAPKKSYAAQVIGMADKLHNLRDLKRVLPDGWTEERRDEYFKWAKEVVKFYYDANPQLSQLLQSLFAEREFYLSSQQT